MSIHGFDPLIQEFALGFVLIRVLPFGFEDQITTRLEANYEVGPKFMHHASIDVKHFESEMIILHPGIDSIAVIQLETVGRFPCAVVDAKVDVRALCGFARLACDNRG